VRKTEGHVGLGASYAHGKAIHFHPLFSITLGLKLGISRQDDDDSDFQPER
jgi:hypothetical protein